MEAPRLREPGGLPTPAILIDSNSSARFAASDRSAPFSIYSSSTAMTIPGTESRIDAPPALPPPKYLPHLSNRHPRDREYDHSLDLTSVDDRPNYQKNHSKYDRDEGYHSLSSFSSTRSQASLPSIAAGFGLQHNRYQFQSGADAFLDMKNKLDPMKTLENKSPTGRSLLSASASDFSRRSSQDARFPPPLSLPTALPFHTKSSVLDSPDRYTQTPLHSAISPRTAPFHLATHAEHRSPNGSDLDRSPPHRSRRTNSDDATASTQGSYDGDEMEIDETNSLRRLRIDDPMRGEGQTIGLKRRASSPPGDEPMLHGMCSQSDLLRRREVTSRGSPTPRLSAIPQGSVSSVSSARASSYASNLSLVTGSSMTSMASYGRRSPGGLSPGGISPITTDPGCGSPFSTPISLTHSPRASLSRAPHQRNISDSRQLASPRKLNEVGKPNSSKLQSFFMCECCPKKPKKFDTRDELSAHEAEKQYECSFCGNRFKNKNEAERHQNSLHVRRHSWSCSALSGYGRAFHESTNRPGEADACGYCGEEFKRSGHGPGASAPRHTTDQDWDERVRHLQEVHKFRECNSSKKFFRADHFRQHLKHSHAGTSGKWTNMLENACMLDEDPTPR